MFHIGTFTLLTFLFLVGCSRQQTALPPEIPPVDAENPTAAMPVPGGEEVREMQVFVEGDDGGGEEEMGVYAAYEEGLIGDGEISVLYFKANWCPYCVKQHAAFQEEYDFPLSTYYLDYDTETVLRNRYSIVSQHTFVKIDGEGNKVGALTFPSEEDLAAFLQG